MVLMQGHYSPGLLPGSASPDRPDIGRPTSQPRTTSLSAIESRLQSIRSNSKVVGIDPEVKAFFAVDVPRLLAIARAADTWAHATTAEMSRRGAELIHAAVRSAN